MTVTFKIKVRFRELLHTTMRKGILSSFLCFGITFPLVACLPDDPPLTDTPIAFVTEIVPSATFVYPTIPPTMTRIPDPSQTATPNLSDLWGDVIFEDDFSLDRGWELGEQGPGAISLQSDRLVIAIRQSNSFLYSLLTPLNMGDFYLEFELRADLCQSGDEFGLMFRVNQEFEHYRFAINCDGGARAVRILSGGSRSLVPSAEPPSVFSGPKSTNRLGLLASGDSFQFWINGLEVFRARDVAIMEGSVGFFVRSGRGNQVTVSFDNLRINSLVTVPTITRTPTP